MPLPQRRDDVAEIVHLRMRQLPDHVRRRVAAQAKGDGVGDVVDADDLHLAGDGGRHPRQACEPAQHRASAIGRRPQHQARPQDDPVEIETREMRIGLRLGAGELGRPLPRCADRGDMDDAPHPCLHAGVEQRAGARDLHRLHVVARAVLQHADAVHDRIDARKQRTPGVGGREPGEVGLDPSRIRKPPPRFLEAAAGPDQIMTVAMKTREHRGADQAVGAGHQNAHAAVLNLALNLALSSGRAAACASSGCGRARRPPRRCSSCR